MADRNKIHNLSPTSQGETQQPEQPSAAAAPDNGASKADVLGPNYSLDHGAWRSSGGEGTAASGDKTAPEANQRRELAPGVWFSSVFQAMEEPFNTLRRMTEEFDREVESFMWGAPGTARRSLAGPMAPMWSPSVDVAQTEQNLKITVDLPGIGKDDVEVEVRDGQLVISGERRCESDRDQDGVQLTERSFGRFVRTLALPEGVDAEGAQARMNDGVLEITLAAPASRRRRIEIDSSRPAAPGA